MSDRWLEKLKRLYRDNPEHRKAIVRLMVVVVTCRVVSRCLGRVMTWHRRKVLVQTVSLTLIFVLLLGSILKQEGDVSILQSREASAKQETAFNVKENGDSSVHLELNTSSIQRQELSGNNGQREADAKPENSSGADKSQINSVSGKKNQVVYSPDDKQLREGNVVASQNSKDEDNSYLLSLVQGTYEDHGQEIDIKEKTMRYQTPVDVLSGDLYREIFSIPDGTTYDEKAVSGAATAITVSGNAIWVEGMEDGGNAANMVGNEVVSEGGASLEFPEETTQPSATPIPEIEFLAGNEQKLSAGDYDIYCTNSTGASICPMLGAMQYHCLYGEEYKVLFAQLDHPQFQLPNDFYGSVMVLGRDEADHTMAGARKYYLIEDHKPEITFSEGGDTYTAPYTLWVNVSDAGHMVSGIQKLSCRVNGKDYEITAMDIAEYTSLGESLKVPSQCYFPVDLQQEGTYDVEVTAVDYAGNEMVKEKKIVVSKPELVSVYMQNQFKIHIDPQQLQKREKIYTDDIVLANVSEFDVKVKIDNISLSVKDDTYSDGVKDCTIYLVTPDTGKKIKLSKGDNKMLYSFILSPGESGKERNLRFVGDIIENSDKMWKDSDISLDIQMSFEKA